MTRGKYTLFAFSIRSQTFGEIDNYGHRSTAMDVYRRKTALEWAPNGRHMLQYGVADETKVISDERGIPYPLQYERHP